MFNTLPWHLVPTIYVADTSIWKPLVSCSPYIATNDYKLDKISHSKHFQPPSNQDRNLQIIGMQDQVEYSLGHFTSMCIIINHGLRLKQHY